MKMTMAYINVSRDVVLSLLVTLLVTLRLVVHWVHRRSPFPGPARDGSTSFLGSVPKLLSTYDGHLYKLVQFLHKQYGKVIGFYLGPFDYHISVADPKLASSALLHAKLRPPVFVRFVPFMSGGPGYPSGQNDKLNAERRKHVGAVVFNQAVQSAAFDKTLAFVQDLAHEWETKGTQLDVTVQGRKISQHLLGSLLFGPWYDNKLHRHPACQQLLDLVPECLEQVTRFQKWPLPQYWNAEYRSWRNDLKRIRPLMKQVLDQAIADVRANPKKYDTKDSILGMLVTQQSTTTPYSEEEAMDVILYVAFGALEDACASLAFAMVTMCLKPEVCEGIKAEFDEYRNKKSTTTSSSTSEDEKWEVSYTDLAHLPYLNSVYEEQHRFFLMGSIVPRYAGKTFSMGSWTVPKGTVVWVDQLTMSRDASIVGKNPNEFIPERYMANADSGNNALAPHPLMYCGSGTRMCLGWQIMSAATKALYLVVSSTHKSRLSFAPESPPFQVEAVGLIRFPVPSPQMQLQ